jgi:hypothetical protein
MQTLLSAISKERNLKRHDVKHEFFIGIIRTRWREWKRRNQKLLEDWNSSYVAGQGDTLETFKAVLSEVSPKMYGQI